MKQKGYFKEIIEFYTDAKMEDIYVYTRYSSGNGATRQTFMGIDYSHRYTCRNGNKVMKYPTDIRDEFNDKKMDRYKIYMIRGNIRDHQVGDNCIFLQNNEAWVKEKIERTFKYKAEYDGYACNLLINPKKFRLHLEHEKFKKEKFMKTEPKVYNITLYDHVSIRYNWRYNTVEVYRTNKLRNEERGDRICIYKNSFGEDRIAGIQNYYSVYEFYRHEALPDILEHIL